MTAIHDLEDDDLRDVAFAIRQQLGGVADGEGVVAALEYLKELEGDLSPEEVEKATALMRGNDDPGNVQQKATVGSENRTIGDLFGGT